MANDATPSDRSRKVTATTAASREPLNPAQGSGSDAAQTQRSGRAMDGRRALVVVLVAVAVLAGIFTLVSALVPSISGDQSCEAALDAYNAQGHVEGGQADITAAQYGQVLNHGAYFSQCQVPASMSVEICAAVQKGRAVGVTVVTRPTDATKASCVASAVRELRFPSHPQLDIVRTRFSAK